MVNKHSFFSAISFFFSFLSVAMLPQHYFNEYMNIPKWFSQLLTDFNLAVKWFSQLLTDLQPCGGLVQVQKLCPYCWEHRAINGSLFNAWGSQNIAMHASSTARNFLLSSFYLPFSFNFIFSNFSYHFLIALGAANAVSPLEPSE